MPQSFLFAKQPIYNKSQVIYGYELLYRGDLLLPPSAAGAGARATTELLINYSMGMTETDINLGTMVFLNLDQDFILSGTPIPLQPDKVILEILEDVKPTPEVLSALKDLRAKGYTLALDDFIFEAERVAFFPFVSIIKVDVIEMTRAYLEENMARFDFSGKTLLAEKVEDQAMYITCEDLGFTLFQGYYMERPTIIKGRVIQSNKQVTLNLVSKLCKEDVVVEEVANLIAMDPSITIKLLNIVNSPLYPFHRKITNLKEAVIKLGLEVVRQWVVVLSLVAINRKPQALLRTLLVRARTCELYATRLRCDTPQDYFIHGLFSGIEAILGIEIHSLLETLHLPEHISDELLPETRKAEGILATVLMFEKGTEHGPKGATKDQLFGLNDDYWAATKWADDLLKIMTV